MPQTMPRRKGSRGARASERSVQVPRLSDEPADGEHHGGDRERGQRAAPPAERVGQRDGEQRRQRRSDAEPRRVDAGPERRPVREARLHRDRQQRARDRDPDPDRQRQREHQARARRRRPRQPERRDAEHARRDRGPQARPRGQRRRSGGEDGHADHGDRGEQPGDRVRDAEVGLDLRQQRPDADELRPQRQRGHEERREQREAGAHADGCCAHKIATGSTIEPVAPRMASGRATNRNSRAPARARPSRSRPSRM